MTEASKRIAAISAEITGLEQRLSELRTERTRLARCLPSPQVVLAHTKEVNCVCYSQDSSLIATGSSDYTVKVWDPFGNPVATLDAQYAPVNAVCFSVPSDRVASGEQGGTLRVWDLNSGTELAQFQADANLEALAVSPSGHLLAAVSKDHKLKLVDLVSHKLVLDVHAHKYPIHDVQFSPNTQSIITVDDGATLNLWHASSLTLQKTMRSDGGPVYCVAFSPCGNYLAFADKQGYLKVKSTAGEGFRCCKFNHHINDLAFSADGETLIGVRSDGMVVLVDFESLVVTAELRAHPPLATAVASSPNGQAFATVGSDRCLKLWDCVGLSEQDTGDLIEL